MPGMPPHDPYLEASRRYAAQAQAAAGLSSPYGSRECLMSDDLMLIHFISKLVIEWPLTGWRQRDLPWPRILSSGFRWPASILRYIGTCQHIVMIMTTLCRSPPTPTPTFTCILMPRRPCR